jgi:hypothetical protein
LQNRFGSGLRGNAATPAELTVIELLLWTHSPGGEPAFGGEPVDDNQIPGATLELERDYLSILR